MWLFLDWFFTDKELQKKVKKFKMINISAAMMFTLGGLGAMGLGIVLILQLKRCVKMRSQMKSIINLAMGGTAS